MADTTIPSRFLIRGGTAAALATLNEVPKDRELILETDTGRTKRGNGATAYNSLPYISMQTAAASGVDTITASFPGAPLLYDGLIVHVRAAGANTGAATFNPNATGALAITKQGGTALAAGDIAAAGHELLLLYRSSVPRWELLNPASSGGGSQAAIQLKDEGSNIGSSGAITSIDFVGSGVSAAVVGTAATVTVSGGSGGSLTLITRTVTSGSATNVSFTSIPGTYEDLEVRVNGRGSAASANVVLRIRFNGDTGANYDLSKYDYNGGSGFGGSGAATTYADFGYLSGATAPANAASSCILSILGYARTVFQKSGRSSGNIIAGTTAGTVWEGMGTVNWRNTAAITQIDVFPASGNFIDGTVVSLYGRT